MVYKTNKKTRRGLIIRRLYLSVRSDLSEELRDSETPFWSSALDFERDLPSTVCFILSAKELIVIQESWLPLLAFPLVLAVASSVCRSHGSIILLVLQLSVSSPSHAAFFPSLVPGLWARLPEVGPSCICRWFILDDVSFIFRSLCFPSGGLRFPH